MKKIAWILMAGILLLSLAACAEPVKETLTKDETPVTEEIKKTDEIKKTEEEKKTEETKKTEESGELDAAGIINRAWDKIAEEKRFPVMGGEVENPVENKAGKIDVKKVEAVTSTLHITEDALGKVEDAAALTHMMNANTFTCASYHLKDQKDATDLAASLKDSIKGTQWMCGFPDMLIIYTVNDEYVVAAFGNKDAIESFQTGLTEAFGDKAVQNVEESLA